MRFSVMKSCIVIILDILYKHAPFFATFHAPMTENFCDFFAQCRCDIDVCGVLILERIAKSVYSQQLSATSEDIPTNEKRCYIYDVLYIM